MSNEFPQIAVTGARVEARRLVEPGTGLALFGAIALAVVGTLLLLVVTYGFLLIALLIYALTAWYLRRKATALIHGSGVHVGPDQFPEIHRCVQDFRTRLNLHKEVEVYIVEDSVVNAVAVRFGKKNVILLTDDLIHGCLASGYPQALAFVLGHELAHIALNHNGVFRSSVSRYLKKLGRLDEYSADAVATALVGDRTIAFYGLLLLTVGYALFGYVNPESLARQAREVVQNKYSKKAERTLSHPLLLHRLHRVLAPG
jgi:Zn-dependent protease with chaperone function